MSLLYNHYYDGENIYDIVKLIPYTQHLPIINIHIDDLKDQLNENVWAIRDSEDNIIGYITPMEVLTEKEASNDFHWSRIHEVDLSYPILVLKDYLIIDGFHRLCKAILNNHTTIKARIISPNLLEKTKIIDKSISI